jgi:hypothetical protein
MSNPAASLNAPELLPALGAPACSAAGLHFLHIPKNIQKRLKVEGT